MEHLGPSGTSRSVNAGSSIVFWIRSESSELTGISGSKWIIRIDRVFLDQWIIRINRIRSGGAGFKWC
jgi:hypothetical protein